MERAFPTRRRPAEGLGRGLILVALSFALAGCSSWVTRDDRWPPRGRWNWAVSRELPSLFREFNGIDFGHAHLAETLDRTLEPGEVEKARLDVLDFIFSAPKVPPDEEQISPDVTRMVWEVQRSFNWTHTFHRSLYDLFADDGTRDKERVYRELLERYLSAPEAITPHPLDHHGALWSFHESKSFRGTFPKFNAQIWSYHWLQAATYDAQLMGGAAQQREVVPRLISHYHGYLRSPPTDWEMMPMMMEAAPEFSRRFPEAAAVFDNLHMLHDNLDDVLTRHDLYPDVESRRAAILKIHEMYLHRNHAPEDRFLSVHAQASGHGEMKGMKMDGMMMGPRPPSARAVIEGKAPPASGAGHGEHP